MVRVACTHMAKGWIGGVLYSRVARTRSYFRGSEGRLIYVSQGPTYVVWSGILSWVFNLETHFSVHHRSINNWNLNKACEGVRYEVS